MVKNLEWIDKPGESWKILSVKNYDTLSDDESLKIQEMFDNKTHHKLLEKFNSLIVILTFFIVLGVLFEFIKSSQEYFGNDLTLWYWIFLISFLIAAICFVKVAFQGNIKEKSPPSINLWIILDLFVRVMTMLAIVTILSGNMQGAVLAIFVVLFILWAFRPIYLAIFKK